jgi:transcriptional regulator with XRE-family HTH domain
VAETGMTFYRKKAGLTQAQLAVRLGIDEGRMSRIENGIEIPSAGEVDQFVEILGVPPTYIFDKRLLELVAERFRAAEAAS